MDTLTWSLFDEELGKAGLLGWQLTKFYGLYSHAGQEILRVRGGGASKFWLSDSLWSASVEYVDLPWSLWWVWVMYTNLWSYFLEGKSELVLLLRKRFPRGKVKRELPHAISLDATIKNTLYSQNKSKKIWPDVRVTTADAAKEQQITAALSADRKTSVFFTKNHKLLICPFCDNCLPFEIGNHLFI